MTETTELSVRDDPKIMKRLEIYRAESAKLYKPSVATVLEKELPEKETIARIPKEISFAAAISCKRCHEVNYKNWLKTKHTKASQTIVSFPKYAQEDCLICHCTGYGKMGEYVTVEEIPFCLRGVQCEACHGEGTSWKGRNRKKGDPRYLPKRPHQRSESHLQLCCLPRKDRLQASKIKCGLQIAEFKPSLGVFIPKPALRIPH
jgi:hypothetical protein